MNQGHAIPDWRAGIFDRMINNAQKTIRLIGSRCQCRRANSYGDQHSTCIGCECHASLQTVQNHSITFSQLTANCIKVDEDSVECRQGKVLESFLKYALRD